jgi:Zn-finger nucleic acid-binding protein
MEKFTYQGYLVDRCLACGCMWFDHDELERVRGDADAAAAIDGPTRVRRRRTELLKSALACPRDRAALVLREHVEQCHVDIDQCPACRGILLDPGELRDLSELTLGERVRRVWRDSLTSLGE